ncbi:MAG: TraR/DksA C4-type zinc finger protein [Patescibacteria group bacterium]
MDKKLIQASKEKLDKEKAALEKQLHTFADQDPKTKGDWDSKFPKFDDDIEGAADEVTEYTTRLPVEFSLESRLKDVNLALKKITEGKYGKCENCGEDIEEERLEVMPAARFCTKHQQ